MEMFDNDDGVITRRPVMGACFKFLAVEIPVYSKIREPLPGMLKVLRLPEYTESSELGMRVILKRKTK